MTRNDYRRALILLRGNAPHYSGHARLERRTLMGSMYFLLQAPPDCDELRVALAGRNRGQYYACALGTAMRDARGQAALRYSFDPRDICGHALEAYQWIVVSCASNCQIVLYGNIAGHADMDWEALRAAVCGLYRQPTDTDVQVLPEPEKASEEAPRQEETTGMGEQDEADPQKTAGEMLELDMDQPWPQSVENLRPIFALSLPMEDAPDEQYTYIAAAMPPESGYAYCAVGVLVENGAPVSVRYALPAQWAEQPPAGLEEYSWVGDFNHGWWMTQLDLTNNF